MSMRALLGIIAGFITALVVTIAMGIVGLLVTGYSVPRDLDPYDVRQVIHLIEVMPASAKAALLVSVFIGALAGGALAKMISKKAWACWAVAALVALYFAFSVLALPLPGWAQAMVIIAPFLGGLIGNHLVKDRPALVTEPLEPAPPEA
jgi:MFS family permease